MRIVRFSAVTINQYGALQPTMKVVLCSFDAMVLFLIISCFNAACECRKTSSTMNILFIIPHFCNAARQFYVFRFDYERLFFHDSFVAFQYNLIMLRTISLIAMTGLCTLNIKEVLVF